MSAVLPPRETMWRIIADVRGGATVSTAAARSGYGRGAIHRWRRVVPGFAADLDHAKRIGRPSRQAKIQFLSHVAGGLSAKESAAQLGLSRSTPFMWAKRDPGFAVELRRVIGPCRYATTTRSLEKALALLARGESLTAACSASGLHAKTVDNWRREGRPQWAMVQRAMAAGAALREGRAA